MTDWSTDQVGFESSDRSDGMVRPPFAFVGITGAVALVSAIFLLGGAGNSAIGYVISVIASLAGGITALTDQKRRGDSNYVAYDSFRWSLVSVRYGVVFIAVLHIIRLAVNAANGGGLFG
jgi:hypothetical protein